MACISLGTIDKSLIVILVGCVFCFLNRLLSKIKVGAILFQSPILTNIYIAMSRFITVIPFIILTIKTKKKITNVDIENLKKHTLLYTNTIKEASKGKWKYILLSVLIYLVNSIFFVESFQIKTNCWIWYILIAALFHYMIFKVKLYRHHYITSILIILIGLTIDLITKNLQVEIVQQPWNLIMKFLHGVLFPLYNVMAKYVMDKFYVSVYEFSFYIGLFNLVILIIFSIFDYYFIKWTPFEEYFKNFDYKQLLIALGVIFSQLGINLTTLFVSKNNSPCHVFIIFVFGQIAYYVDKFSGIYPVVIALLIIILFLSLIFNEIIEINFFGLSYNTRKNIMMRAEIEAIGKNKYEYGSEKDSQSVNENEKEKEKEVDKEKENKDEKNDDSCEDPENSLNSKKRQIIYDDNYYFKI